jgi:molecular chaperone GrpE
MSEDKKVNDEKLKIAPKKEEEKLSAHEELPQLQESYVRLLADFDNFRKRTIRENELALEYANEKLVKDLLVIFDDLDHYEKSLNTEEEKRGVELLKGKFLGILSAHGVKVIDPLGEKFNPECAEALQVLKTNKKEDNNKIVEIISKGYKLKDRFLRYPKVVVYKFNDEK